MGDFQECGGILTWTGEDDIAFIDNVEIQEKLSDLHNYCHGRQQQTDILHREVRAGVLNLLEVMDPFEDLDKAMDPYKSAT